MRASSSGPKTGCSATASIRWLQRRAPCSSLVAASAIARARRWRCDILVDDAFAGGDAMRALADRTAQRRLQLLDAALAHRHRLDHRRAEFARQRLGVDHQPVAPRHVDHIERHHRRQAEGDQLQGEAEMIVEIGGVDHDDQRRRQPLARLLAQHHVARHLLVGAGGIEAVGAGQVDEFDRSAVRQAHPACLALHRHARIVADLLARAGHGIEQRALAGIGIADQRDHRCGIHGARPLTPPGFRP